MVTHFKFRIQEYFVNEIGIPIDEGMRDQSLRATRKCTDNLIV